MARRSNKKIAENYFQLFKAANGSWRKKWRSVSQKCEDFYLNDQLTGEEQKALQESGMPSFVINRITPVIEMMKYFVTANNPRWQAVGSDGSDTNIAAIHADLADYCWYQSNGRSVFSHVIQDSLVKGVGYFLIDIDPDADRGMGEVLFKRLDPYDVYVDPMSRDFLFRDAGYIQIRKILPKKQLKLLFPEHVKKIAKATGSPEVSSDYYSQRNSSFSDNVIPEDIGDESYEMDGSRDNLLDYYETYEKIKIAFINLNYKVPPDEEMMKQIQQEVEKQMEMFVKELEVAFKEQIKSLQEQVESGEMLEERANLEKEKISMQNEEALEAKQQELTSILQQEKTKVANIVITEEEYNTMLEAPAFRKQVIDSVKFYDTRVKLTCTLGNDTVLYDYLLPSSEYPIVPICYQWVGTPYPVSAVSPLVGKQQEINKAHQLMIHNANLASNLRWMYQEGSVPEEEWEQYSSSPGALLKYRQGFEAPSPIQPAPLNNAFFGIVTEGKQDLEYMSGVYSSMQGAAGASHETYRGMLAVDEHGTRRIKAWMQSTVEPGLEHLGKVFKDIAQQTYKANKVFRIVQPDTSESKRVEINVPIYSDFGNTIDKFNDYASARFDVRIVGGSTLPVNRWALMEEYFRWYQAGLIDDIAMLSETDIRNKEQIIKRKSVYSQMKSQIDSMEEEMKDMTDTNETLERQIIQAGIKDQIREADKEIYKDKVDSKSMQNDLRKTMEKEISFAKRDLDSKKKTAEREYRAGLRSAKNQIVNKDE
jgi:hypothetical protein|tara:strand:- start:1510 stop:3798 length:2289 start_codon:yes stop_codon:yes gene_type:complete